MNNNIQKVFNTNELANYLHVSAQTINKLRKNKELPYFKIGRNIFFNKDSIDLWIHQQELKNLKSKKLLVKEKKYD